ncbi:uba/thif-type NAD/fad binding protein [Luminiphilus syltensis NOR5-1B]|uniref:Uba/thif-type NAD/fad binding protein n=1 Tax=Luminiphilus syltensis NOR5-1B TaxID=565045 RepID=B8KRA5_9GAMM|nr:HesA/MoeB/ThiF family protein [Luminiphilus syltensis]EED36664.1 uba/thif-type NAD/fad binding protein [Luminiphilus syltensis NOR5-1B]
MISDQQLERYSRQILVPGIDFAGQEAISSARVLVVGCGGLGCPIALYLAGAGVQTLRLVDDDCVELSNLARQIAFTEADIDQPKVGALQARLQALNSEVTVDAYFARFTSDNAQQMLADIDLVIDASDSRGTRSLIDLSTRERQIPWIMGAAVQMSGMWAAFSPGRSEGCYHCLMPDSVSGQPADCATLGILGPVVAMVASAQSALALKYLADPESIAWGRLSLLDMRSEEVQRLNLQRNPQCPYCGPVNGSSPQ